MEQETKKTQNSMLDNKDFVKGIGVGFLVFCTIGFFILLAMNFNGTGLASDSGESKTIKKVAADSGAQPTQPSGDSGAQPTAVVINDITSDDYIYGDPNAPVTIVEYSDLECPFCQRFHPTVEQIVNDSEGQVNWVYRHFPLTSIHPKAQKYAEGAECVGDLGGNDAYWEYLQIVFDTQPELSGLATVASQVGVDSGAFQECLDSGQFAQDVNDDASDAQNAGGRGTPYSVIVGPNGETIPMSGALPAAQVQGAIDSLLN